MPSLYPGSKPKDFVGRPADYGQKMSDDYVLHHYHQVSDEVNPAWDCPVQPKILSSSSKSVIGSRTMKNIGLLAGSEFKAKRDATMSQKK